MQGSFITISGLFTGIGGMLIVQFSTSTKKNANMVATVWILIFSVFFILLLKC